MVKIKLVRIGRKAQPDYRIVVIEEREKRNGRYTDNLGHYNPAREPKVLVLDKTKYEAWIKKGAQPTLSVANLVKKHEKSS